MIKKLQYSDDYISEENINQNINTLYGAMIPILTHRRGLYERYTRADDQSDVVVALEYYISNIASGYFAGKEPQYKVKSYNDTQKGVIQRVLEKVFGDKNKPEDYQAIVDYITAYNDNASFFYDLVKDYINTGACYGLLYENSDNEIVYAHTSSLNTVAIWNYDIPAQKIGLLRYWTENTTKGLTIYLEVLTSNYKKLFVNGVEKENDVLNKNHEYKFEENQSGYSEILWDDLPAIAVENNDGLALYENVITLINKFQQVLINNANTFQYNDEAKLKITGFMPRNEALIPERDEKGAIIKDDNGNDVMVRNPARDMEDAVTLNAKIFYTPDKSGDIDWITKDINDSASENHKKTMLDMCLMISGVPNVTDQGFTNADNSSALEKKFFPLDQVLQQADKQFKKELLRMWEMITHRINIKKNTNYDFRDIEVILNRNLPSNNSEIVATWKGLRGLISDKTIIEHLPYDLDSESELNAMDEQNVKNMEENLERLKKLGGENVGDTRSEDDKSEPKIQQRDEKDKGSTSRENESA